MNVTHGTTTKRKHYWRVGITLLVTLILSISASYAAQVIYIDILDFTPDRSDYILDDAQREVKLQRLTVPLAIGNAWRIIEDSDALGAKAMDCPGDSDTDTTFSELTFEFQINAGETGPWAVWGAAQP